MEYTYYRLPNVAKISNQFTPDEQIPKWVRSQVSKRVKKLGLEDFSDDILWYPVVTRAGPKGFGYLYARDPRLINMILGLEPDGSPRQEITYVGDVEELEKLRAEEVDALQYESGMAWGDFMEEIDNINDKYKPKMVVTKLPSLFNADAFYKNDSSFEIEPYDKVLGPEFNPDTLVLPKVASNVTELDIMKEFSPFSSVRGYPIVSFSSGVGGNGRTAFIKFANQGDARAAQLIKFIINIKGKSYITGHAYKTTQERLK